MLQRLFSFKNHHTFQLLNKFDDHPVQLHSHKKSTVTKMTNINCLLIFLIIPTFISSSNSTNTIDFYALQSFKSTSDIHNHLSSWNPSANPCSSAWLGVTCEENHVTKLVLEGLNLTGTIQALTLLTNLDVLSLKNNSLSDPIHFLNLLLWQRHLKILYLSNNQFSGPFPENLALLHHLRRLDLSNNRISGQIPAGIGFLLPRLNTLRLEKNSLTGQIPASLGHISGLYDLNLSYNSLVGEIPESLSLFPNSCFIGNVGLLYENGSKSWVKRWMLIALLVSCVLVCVGGFVAFAYCIYKKGGENRNGNVKKYEKIMFFEGCREFVMEDLMRSSAEMLGKGMVGSTYRVVMDGLGGEDGVVVKRVKKDRLKKVKKEWNQVDRWIKEIGTWRNPNVVSLLAYYSSDKEILLVYQYVSKGSLHNRIHENRGPGRTPLNWKSRYKIALSAAKGLTFLSEKSKFKLSHYHLTSSNILIDQDDNALISDFALHQLLAPQDILISNDSTTCQVHSFGLVLLEMLTGRLKGENELDLVKWVHMVVEEGWTTEVFDFELKRGNEFENEMIALLQIALHCLNCGRKSRPKIAEVHKMIADITPSSSPNPQ